MPSFTARAVQWLLRTTGTYKKLFSGGPDFHKYQAQALAVPSEPSAKIRAALDVSQASFAGRPVWTIAPKQGTVSAEVLFWHGGGYVYPAAAAHWDFVAHMAETHGWRMIVPLYPLAPDHDVEVIAAFALDLYRDIPELSS